MCVCVCVCFCLYFFVWLVYFVSFSVQLCKLVELYKFYARWKCGQATTRISKNVAGCVDRT